MKFSVPAFLKAGAEIGSGEMEGKRQAELYKQQQYAQQFQNLLQAHTLARQNQADQDDAQDKYDQTLLSALPNLPTEQQGPLYQGILARRQARLSRPTPGFDPSSIPPGHMYDPFRQLASPGAAAPAPSGPAPDLSGFHVPNPQLTAQYATAKAEVIRRIRETTDPILQAQLAAHLQAIEKGEQSGADINTLHATYPGASLPGVGIMPGGVASLPAKDVPLGAAGLANLPQATNLKPAEVRDTMRMVLDTQKHLTDLAGRMAADDQYKNSLAFQNLQNHLKQGVFNIKNDGDMSKANQWLGDSALFAQYENALSVKDREKAKEFALNQDQVFRGRIEGAINNRNASPKNILDAIDEQHKNAAANGAAGLAPYGDERFSATPRKLPTSTSTPGPQQITAMKGSIPVLGAGPNVVTEGTRDETPEEVDARRLAAAAEKAEKPEDQKRLMARSLGRLMSVFGSKNWSRYTPAQRDGIVQQIGDTSEAIGQRITLPTDLPEEQLTPAQRASIDLQNRRIAISQANEARLEAASRAGKPAKINQTEITAARQDVVDAHDAIAQFLKRPDVAGNDPASAVATRNNSALGQQKGKPYLTGQPGWTLFPKPGTPAFDAVKTAIDTGKDTNPLHAEYWRLLDNANRKELHWKGLIANAVKQGAAPPAQPTAQAAPAGGFSPGLKQARVQALDAYRAKHGEPTAEQRNMIFRAVEQGLVK